MHIIRLSDAQYEMWDPFKGHNSNAWVRRWTWPDASLELHHVLSTTVLYDTTPTGTTQGAIKLWEDLGYHWPKSCWGILSRILLDHDVIVEALDTSVVTLDLPVMDSTP